MATDFYHRRFGLLTLHGKENVIAPLFTQHLNASLTVTRAMRATSHWVLSW